MMIAGRYCLYSVCCAKKKVPYFFLYEVTYDTSNKVPDFTLLVLTTKSNVHTTKHITSYQRTSPLRLSPLPSKRRIRPSLMPCERGVPGSFYEKNEEMGKWGNGEMGGGEGAYASRVGGGGGGTKQKKKSLCNVPWFPKLPTTIHNKTIHITITLVSKLADMDFLSLRMF